MITLQLLKSMWPHGNAVVPGLVEGIVAAAPTVFPQWEIDTPLTVAHAMAQFSHECGAGLCMVENMNYSAERLMQIWPTRYDEAKAKEFAHKPIAIANNSYNGRMGNRIGTDDGWNYRGRGLSQTTGHDGYKRLADVTGLDLLDKPALILDPANALECGVVDFILCGCLPYAKADDIVMVTKQLNGGQIGLPQRRQWLLRWKQALGA